VPGADYASANKTDPLTDAQQVSVSEDYFLESGSDEPGGVSDQPGAPGSVERVVGKR
jgi:hypothetical protein